MDVLSAIIGGAIAGLPQIISHLLGSRKDRLARRLAHYEARLAAARHALGRFEGLASAIDYSDVTDQHLDEVQDTITEPFGEPLADEAMRSLSLGDKGESYRSCLARMKAHIVDLEKKGGIAAAAHVMVRVEKQSKRNARERRSKLPKRRGVAGDTLVDRARAHVISAFHR